MRTVQGAPTAAFQVMPPLSAEEYAALRDDIAERGIVVPVVVDQHGRLLDGHHRRQIADELQIDCPIEVRQVTDDEDARNVAFTLNLARRHLSREQRRELIAREAAARPGDSDRASAPARLLALDGRRRAPTVVQVGHLQDGHGDR